MMLDVIGIKNKSYVGQKGTCLCLLNLKTVL